MSVVAVIPARGGSKRLPRKNLALIDGRSILEWTIRSSLACASIDFTAVSTEDAQIAQVAKDAGVNVIARPKSLAIDSTPTQPVLVHAIRELQSTGHTPETLVLLQPTSPLRKASHIDACMRMYEGEGSVISVVETSTSPFKAMFLDPAGEATPIRTWDELESPQDRLPRTFRPNGAIYVCNVRELVNSGRLFQVPVRLFPMTLEESVDIDTDADLQMAREIMERPPVKGPGESRPDGPQNRTTVRL